MQQQYQSIFADYWTRQSPLWKYGKPNIQTIDHELYQSPKDNPIKIRDVQDKLTNRGYYHLINEYLISNSCYINTTNLSLRHINFKKTQGLQIYGKKDCLQLFGDNQLIEMWFKYLAKYTIQQSFYKKFNVLKIVGKGSHAKVYQVKRKADNEIFAVKVFKKDRIFAKKDGKESLMKEIEIMRRLQHPGIINLHEVYEDDDYVYLVIDFLYGGELLKQIENCENGYSEQQVQMIMNNLLTSLKFIHSKNILHRDIKPENLILRVENDITDLVIADFGLSDFYDQKGEYMFQRCGTIGYVAPEVLKEENYDFKVDMFSAGVIMFILLTGEMPFDTDDSDELITFNLLCQIDYNKLSKKKITPQAQDLVRLLLDEQVQIRLTAEQALMHDWFTIQNFEPLKSLSMTKIPQIVNNQNPELFSSTPLWNQSIHSDQSSPLQNFQLDDIDESVSENNYFQQFTKQDQYEIGEDCIDEGMSPSSMVPKYKLLVRQRSLD